MTSIDTEGVAALIDHDVEIETEQLTEAADGLKKVLDIVGDVPSVIEAQEKIGEAVADMGDLEGLEDRLTAGRRHVERAQELVIGYGEHVAKLHSEGRLKVSNDSMTALVRLLVDVGDACGRWLDYAEKELRDLS